MEEIVDFADVACTEVLYDDDDDDAVTGADEILPSLVPVSSDSEEEEEEEEQEEDNGWPDPDEVAHREACRVKDEDCALLARLRQRVTALRDSSSSQISFSEALRRLLVPCVTPLGEFLVSIRDADTALDHFERLATDERWLREEDARLLRWTAQERFSIYDLAKQDGALMLLVYMLQPLTWALPNVCNLRSLWLPEYYAKFRTIRALCDEHQLPAYCVLGTLWALRFDDGWDRMRIAGLAALLTARDRLEANCLGAFSFAFDADTYADVCRRFPKDEKEPVPQLRRSWLRLCASEAVEQSARGTVRSLPARRRRDIVQWWRITLERAIALTFPGTC